MTKYKTIALSYGNGESELIDGMSGYNWGLINIFKPDYSAGKWISAFIVDHNSQKTALRLRFARNDN